MAVSRDGELIGSIGGGVMEVNLVEEVKLLLTSVATQGTARSKIIEQEHRKNSKHPSGMICSGQQTVIVNTLSSNDIDTVNKVLDHSIRREPITFEISNSKFQITENASREPAITFAKLGDTEFVYRERLGRKADLFIIGGGHCALALSGLASKLGFRINIFDDRPSLNTLDKNEYADAITIVESYDQIASHIPNGNDVYVLVMTLGYVSDTIVVRQLIDHDVKYLGVLGSKAKMATLMKELKHEGLDPKKLARIHAPIGIPINSHSPEEIAVSIAAEIIAIKNG